MRLVIALAAAAALQAMVVGGPTVSAAAAAGPVSTQPLAPGEVLLELTLIGSVRSPPDRAAMSAIVESVAATPAEAARAQQALIARVTEAARAAGVRSEDIEMVAPLVGIVPPDVVVEPETDDEERPPDVVAVAQEHLVRSAIRFQLRDPGRVEAVRRALEQAGAQRVWPPTYSLSDDRAARRAATEQAIRLAQAEAEEHAAALGMRVVRIVRVTQRLGMEAFNLFADSLGLTRRLREDRERDAEVETRALVGVDFALAPR